MKRIPYSKQLISEDDIRRVCEAMRSERLTQGPLVEAFEDAFAEYTGASYAVAFANGTAALHAMYIAAGIGQGDEVIVPTLTFAATASAAIMCGAKPVLVDIDPAYGLIDPNAVEQAITPKTKAVVPVHYAGHPADLDAIGDICDRHGIALLEDACHALGSTYKDNRIGSQNCCAFSLHPVKPITAAEGGTVTTNSKDMAEKLKRLRHHGIERNGELQRRFGAWFYRIDELGFNYRLSELHAALGLSQLERCDEFRARRRRLADRYIEAFEGIRGIRPLVEPPWGESTYHLFVILVEPHGSGKDRRWLFDELARRGIQCQVHYIPLHYQPYYQRLLGVKQGDFPGAEEFYSRAMSIPLYAGLTDAEQGYIIATIGELWSEERWSSVVPEEYR